MFQLTVKKTVLSSSRAILIKPNENKFENHVFMCATCVFHQFLCVSIVQFKLICKTFRGKIGYYRANLDFMLIEIRCELQFLTHSVITNWTCAVAHVSFVPYLKSLVNILSNVCVYKHCALVCLVEFLIFWFATSVWNSQYELNISFHLFNSVSHNHLDLVIYSVIVMFISY